MKVGKSPRDSEIQKKMSSQGWGPLPFQQLVGVAQNSNVYHIQMGTIQKAEKTSTWVLNKKASQYLCVYEKSYETRQVCR